MLIKPPNNAPRLSWNRPQLDSRLYPDQGPTLFVFGSEEERVTPEKIIFQQALRIIAREYGNPDFGIDQLSKEVGFSPRQLQRIFKNQGSPGFRAEIKERRLRHARQELAAGDKSLEQIAVECGYRQSSHFSRVFSKELGLTPSEYRQKKLPVAK
jgi:AraC-like DNA-binding protein